MLNFRRGGFFVVSLAGLLGSNFFKSSIVQFMDDLQAVCLVGGGGDAPLDSRALSLKGNSTHSPEQYNNTVNPLQPNQFIQTRPQTPIDCSNIHSNTSLLPTPPMLRHLTSNIFTLNLIKIIDHLCHNNETGLEQIICIITFNAIICIF